MNGGTFPSTERVWVYAAPRTLTGEELRFIREALEDFVRNWSDHGVNLQSSYDILHDRFLLLFGKNPHGRVDGCAIDTSLNFIKQLGSRLGIDFLDRMSFHYLDNGKVHTVKRAQLPNYLAEGRIKEDTLFFNTLVQTREEYENKWLIPFKDHWVKRLMSSSGIISH